MRLFVDTENYDIDICYSEDEGINSAEGFVSDMFTLCVAMEGIFAKFLSYYFNSVEDVVRRKDLILKELGNLMNKDEFRELIQYELEEKLYDTLDRIFGYWLDKEGYGEEEYFKLFHGLPDVKLEFEINEDVNIYLEAGTNKISLQKFPCDVIQNDEEEFQKNCNVAFIVGLMTLDKLYGSENNYLRKWSKEAGSMNYGLAKKIVEVMKN